MTSVNQRLTRPIGSQQGTVLIVTDDVPFRRGASACLMQVGLAVRTTGSTLAELADLFETSPADVGDRLPWRAVVIDLSELRSDVGLYVLHLVRAVDPYMPVILIADGKLRHHIWPTVSHMRRLHFLLRPVGRDALIELITTTPADRKSGGARLLSPDDEVTESTGLI